jgi:hypothetical protein
MVLWQGTLVQRLRDVTAERDLVVHISIYASPTQPLPIVPVVHTRISVMTVFDHMKGRQGYRWCTPTLS